jgi:hypothetical protein
MPLFWLLKKHNISVSNQWKIDIFRPGHFTRVCWSKGSHSATAVESRAQHIDMASFQCQTEIWVTWKLLICWAPPLSVWSHDILSLWIAQSLTRLRKANCILDAVRKRQRGLCRGIERLELCLAHKFVKADSFVGAKTDRTTGDMTRTIITEPCVTVGDIGCKKSPDPPGLFP